MGGIVKGTGRGAALIEICLRINICIPKIPDVGPVEIEGDFNGMKFRLQGLNLGDHFFATPKPGFGEFEIEVSEIVEGSIECGENNRQGNNGEINGFGEVFEV
ncbi:MAG: hypothetical protein KatS3mg087_1457 [Patescibacteria group bacterium]|nr:MAG: hypothetical protein KatS3mg087_1457 [Patescibacteria group bacterium]